MEWLTIKIRRRVRVRPVAARFRMVRSIAALRAKGRGAQSRLIATAGIRSAGAISSLIRGRVYVRNPLPPPTHHQARRDEEHTRRRAERERELHQLSLSLRVFSRAFSLFLRTVLRNSQTVARKLWAMRGTMRRGTAMASLMWRACVKWPAT